MRRFQFKLQSVLDHRQRKERLAHLDFGQAQAQLGIAEKMQAELEEVRDTIIGELGERRLSGAFDPEETRLCHEYLKEVKRCIAEQEAYVADLASTVEALRLHLVGASQERQVLDHMKTKARSAHHTAALKSEQAATDDLSTARRQYQRVQAGQE